MKKNRIYRTIGYVCLLAAMLSACQERTEMAGTRLLAEGWKVQSAAQAAGQAGGVLSTPDAATDGWYDAVVPSTVMGTLTRNGVYADALVGMNYKEIDKTLFDTTWWYRTEFTLPRLRRGQHAALELDGISYAANLWLNGRQIAGRDSVHGSFRRFRLDITDALQEKNVLAVEVYRGQAGEPNIGFVDWNPRPADESMGIFREVRVVTCGEVAMQHTAVRSKVNTETLDEAWLTVETTLTNLSGSAVSGELKGTLEGSSFSLPVSLEAGEERTVRITPQEADVLHLRHPRLWWCHNMGNPEMYRMELAFHVGGTVSDCDTVDFGVREVKDYFTAEGQRGFLLNGKPVLLRSAGWTDDIFLRDTPQTNEVQVQYVRDMNLNSIRFENIWGTSQNIYDLCDRYGLLALVGWSCHWEWENYLGTPCDDFGGIRTEADMDLIAHSLRDQVLWLRNHPGIIAWFVGSDMLPRPELERRYMSFLPEIDNRPYIGAAKELTSELTGLTGTKMAGPYDYVAPNYWYAPEAPGGAFGFNTETGIGAQLPVRESIEKMIPADKLWPLNEVWDYHCTTAGEDMHSLRVLKEEVAAHYGTPTDLDDFLRKADLLNYEGTRAMFEAFRVNIPRATGIVQWMLNSAWPSLYWQLYDYYRVPTAAYYSVKRANAPQQLVYDYGKHAVCAVNEGADTCRMQASMVLCGLDGQVQLQQHAEVEVAPYTVSKVFDVPALQGSNAFLSLSLHTAEGTRADNFYCLSARPDVNDWSKTTWIRTPLKQAADFTALASLPEADCQLQAVVYKKQGDELTGLQGDKKTRGEVNEATSSSSTEKSITVEVTLENSPEALAFFLRLSLKDALGELLVPIFWEDNYLSLLPGEKRVLTCRVPHSALPASGNLTLTLCGWNVPEKKLELSLAD